MNEPSSHQDSALESGAVCAPDYGIPLRAGTSSRTHACARACFLSVSLCLAFSRSHACARALFSRSLSFLHEVVFACAPHYGGSLRASTSINTHTHTNSLLDVYVCACSVMLFPSLVRFLSACLSFARARTLSLSLPPFALPLSIPCPPTSFTEVPLSLHAHTPRHTHTV